MTIRYVTVGDDLQLPPAVKTALLTGAVRTNLCPRPISSTVAALTGWTAPGPSVQSGYLHAALVDGATAHTWSNTPLDTNAVTPGVTYTVQAQARSNTGFAFQLLLKFFNAAFVQVGSNVTGAAVTLGPSIFTSLAPVTVTAPATSAWLQITTYAPATANPTSSFLDFRQVIIESSPVAGTYFDGATTGSGVTCAWTGTADASSSTATYVSLSSAQTVSAAATDAATTQTLANSLRSALIALGVVS